MMISFGCKILNNSIEKSYIDILKLESFVKGSEISNLDAFGENNLIEFSKNESRESAEKLYLDVLRYLNMLTEHSYMQTSQEFIQFCEISKFSFMSKINEHTFKEGWVWYSEKVGG